MRTVSPVDRGPDQCVGSRSEISSDVADESKLFGGRGNGDTGIERGS